MAAPFVYRPSPLARPVIRHVLPGGALHEILQGIYNADQTVVVADHPVGAAIVPHHLTSAQAMASGIRALTHDAPATILLLSPDHFSRCPTLLCTTNGTFETLLGTVETDDALVDTLAASPLVTVDPHPFKQEHGIGTLMPFIAHYLPQTRVVPVVLSRLPGNESGALLTAFRKLQDRGTTLVVSSDFSHYLPEAEAELRDEETAKALFAGDLAGILALHAPGNSDCPACLWMLAALGLEYGYYNPSVLLHTNSARLLDDPRIRETTSHFAMVWYRNGTLGPGDAAFGGDVTVTRNIHPPRLPADIEAFWSGDGIRVLNLEGPLSDECMPRDNPFIFCNKLDVWQGIAHLATHWGTVNNHTFDLGTGGYLKTVSLLGEAGEIAVDVPTDAGNLRLYPVTSIMNPSASPAGFPQKTYQKTIAALQESDAATFDVVFVHYGTEYVPLISDAQRAYLRSFVDAGADAVIGMHSHVQSDMEIYHGKPIFHGIGNFLFDQFATVPTSTAKIVRLRMQEGTVLFETYLHRHSSQPHRQKQTD